MSTCSSDSLPHVSLDHTISAGGEGPFHPSVRSESSLPRLRNESLSSSRMAAVLLGTARAAAARPTESLPLAAKPAGFLTRMAAVLLGTERAAATVQLREKRSAKHSASLKP